MTGKAKMPYHLLNIPYDSNTILNEIKDLDYKPLVQHLDNQTYPDWLLADLPVDSHIIQVCNEFVSLFETRLQVPPRALRFQPPQVNESHIDGPLAKGVINIVIGDGFKLQIEDKTYDFHTSIFDIKRMHRLLDIHSTIYLVRMDVKDAYDKLLETALRKNLVIL